MWQALYFNFSKLSKLAQRLRARQAPSLVEITDQARRDLQDAWKEFHLANNELIDYAIFKINTAERRLVNLLQQARRQGLTAWPPIS